jgi:Dopa 4,5-dioxygenase family
MCYDAAHGTTGLLESCSSLTPLNQRLAGFHLPRRSLRPSRQRSFHSELPLPFPLGPGAAFQRQAAESSFHSKGQAVGGSYLFDGGYMGAAISRDTPVGPHTQSMYQIAFPPPLLASFLPWLMLNRDGLSILLHPGTGDAYADHIDHAVWLGSVVPLRMNVLRKSRKTPSHS